MGRFILLLAFLLLIGSIVFFVVALIGPENAWMQQIFSTALCEEDEKLVQWFGRYIPRSGSSSGGTETAYFCEDAEGEQVDVTGGVIGLMVGGFAIPFIVSLLLFFVGAGMMVANRVKAVTKNVFDLTGGTPTWNAMTKPQTSMQVIDLRDGSYQGGEIPPEKLQQVQNIMQQFGFGDMAANMGASGGGSLAERLKELEDARNQGLINQEEYAKLRQAILDNIDN